MLYYIEMHDGARKKTTGSENVCKHSWNAIELRQLQYLLIWCASLSFACSISFHTLPPFYRPPYLLFVVWVVIVCKQRSMCRLWKLSQVISLGLANIFRYKQQRRVYNAHIYPFAHRMDALRFIFQWQHIWILQANKHKN